MEKIEEKLTPIFESFPEVKLVYFFGSRVSGETGPLSDYDFALYFDAKDKKKMFDLKFLIQDRIGRALKTDKIDIVILNLTESPEMKYQIIKEGRLIYDQEPFRVLLEPKILSEYFDFHYMLNKYDLTKVKL
jgi:uncharacterized protein